MPMDVTISSKTFELRFESVRQRKPEENEALLTSASSKAIIASIPVVDFLLRERDSSLFFKLSHFKPDDNSLVLSLLLCTKIM